jgi:hypothetical protein
MKLAACGVVRLGDTGRISATGRHKIFGEIQVLDAIPRLFLAISETIEMYVEIDEPGDSS